MSRIAFGPSGWRGIIAEDFTFTGVRAVSQAIGEYARSQDPLAAERGIVIGHDTRFLSEAFGAQVARVLAAQGVKAFLCDQDTPTPAVAHEILQRHAAGGVIVTAGGNPPEHNGIKFSAGWGGPARREATRQIEDRANALLAGPRVVEMPAGQAEAQGLIERIDPRGTYLERLRSLVSLEVIREAQLKVVIDPLYGCAQNYLDTVLRDAGCDVTVLHNWRDPNFGGHDPDPSEGHLQELAFQVVETSAHLGLATDGDADRFGLVDADGAFVEPNYFLGLLLRYLVKARGWTGGVGRSVATSHLLDAVARRFGIPVHETPVGFEHIGELIVKDATVLGGEENGGLSVKGHVPERDGILACLLAAELIASCGRARLRTLLQELYAEVGAFLTKRLNYRLDQGTADRLQERLMQPPGSVAGLAVIEVKRLDGVKLILEDGSWLLFRLSELEPAVQFYAEAGTQEHLDRLVTAGEALIGQ
jgi:alpha-D-glucose phosphate-specific phosphoglucomutase